MNVWRYLLKGMLVVIVISPILNALNKAAEPMSSEATSIAGLCFVVIVVGLACSRDNLPKQD